MPAYLKYRSEYSWEEFYTLSQTWESTAKAREVLYSVLTPTQIKSYKQTGEFVEPYHRPGVRFSIRMFFGQHWNVILNGNPWCAVNRQTAYWGPAEVCMMSQLLLLRVSVSAFKNIGHSSGSPHTIFHVTDNDHQKVAGYFNMFSRNIEVRPKGEFL